MKLFRRRTKLEKFYYDNEEFIKYCGVSALCTLVLYLVFFVVDLVTKGNYLLANFFSYTISFALLFYLNQKVFKSKPKRKRDKLSQLIIFIIIRVIGFPLDSLVLSLLITKVHMKNMIAKVVGSLIMFIYNYITNKLFVFKKQKFI